MALLKIDSHDHAGMLVWCHSKIKMNDCDVLHFELDNLFDVVSIGKMSLDLYLLSWGFKPKCLDLRLLADSHLFMWYHTQRWLRQTSLPPKQTSLQLSGLVYEYKGDSDSIMQTSLPQ